MINYYNDETVGIDHGYAERYQRGSFRGLPFFTQTWSVQVGQRRGVFEIPFDDSGAASVNLGRKPRRFRIDALLLGPNVDQDAQAFIAAIEARDAGLLVHPVLGQIMVVPGDAIDVHGSPQEGGAVSVGFEATESRARTAPVPQAQTTTRASLPKATAQLRVANQEAFEKNFTLAGVADFVRDANLATLDKALQNLRLANGAVSAVLSVPGQFATQIDAISLQLASLLDSPERLYAALAGAIEKVFAAVGRVSGRFGVDVTLDSPDAARPDAVVVSIRALKQAIAASDLTEGSPPPGQRNTPPRIQERVNRGIMDQSLQAASLAAIVDAANLMELPSVQDNRAVRDSLLAAIENLLLQELDSGVVEALEDVRAEVRRRYTNAGTAVTTFLPHDSMPADVIAYQLYGDSERADEIVARNEIADPGEVQGLVALEVLAE